MNTLKKAILYIHGKNGSHLEAENYKQNCVGFDIIGVDYDGYLPWVVEPQIKAAYTRLVKEYKPILVIANSIGAYFAMHALQKCALKKALFISPILDMERLILDMMQWAKVTEKELCEKRIILTDFGETLSWEYLCFVRNNPIEWDIPTEILYAEKDNLTARATVDAFVKKHNANLTTLKNGEHWFHTKDQLAYVNQWMKKSIGSV
ncbi:alpha/beta hydrolase [Ruminococcaceae bacterium OttesenSCG-928-A16]|nr:alpha/beta hydrolase [Ruminococcaceae bacterium OttesenSCG-928-A16]